MLLRLAAVAMLLLLASILSLAILVQFVESFGAAEVEIVELCCLTAAASEARGTLKVFGLVTSGTQWAAEEEPANVVEVVVIKLLL